MILPGQAYRPSGLFNPVSAIVAILGAMVVSMAAAAIIWVWGISPVPRFVIVTSIMQGLLVGGGAYLWLRVCKMRNPALATVIGLICGVVSVTAVYYGDYLYFLHQVHVDLHQKLVSRGLPPGKIAEIEKSADTSIDRVLIKPKTGHTGFVGFLLFKNSIGERVGRDGTSNAQTTGTALWALWGFEALVVLIGGAVGARNAASQPFCEDCDRWFAKPKQTLWLPPRLLQPLTDAVRSGDVSAVTALKPESVAFDPAPGSATAALRVCDSCAQTLVDVKLRKLKKKGQYTEKSTLKHWSVTPAMVTALRPAPSPPESEPT